MSPTHVPATRDRGRRDDCPASPIELAQSEETIIVKLDQSFRTFAYSAVHQGVGGNPTGNPFAHVGHHLTGSVCSSGSTDHDIDLATRVFVSAARNA
jgi:hypothetical protein